MARRGHSQAWDARGRDLAWIEEAIAARLHAGRCRGDVMTLQEAQALMNPFVRCRDGRIGQILRVRAGYATVALRPGSPVTDSPRARGLCP